MSNITGNNTSNIIGANNTTNILGQTGNDVSGATNQFQILMAQKQEDQAVIHNLRQRMKMMEQSSTLQVEALKQQMLQLQETNVKLKGNVMGCENPMSIASVHENKGHDQHTQEIISLLQQENRQLKEDLGYQKRQTDNSEFEVNQLKSQVNQIDSLYKRIETLQGTENEMSELIKRQAELEMNVI